MTEQPGHEPSGNAGPPDSRWNEDLDFKSDQLPELSPRALRGARAEREGAWTAERVHQALWESLPYDGWSILEEVTTTSPPVEAPTKRSRKPAAKPALNTVTEPVGLGATGKFQKPRRIDVLALRDPGRQTAADVATAQGLLGALGRGAWNDLRTKPPAAGFDFGLMRLLAVEIKVTRADFRSDVADPDKQAPWRTISHQHAYAVPEGLVDVAELPKGSGLIEVRQERVHASWAPPEGALLTRARWARQAPYSAGGLTEELLLQLMFRATSAEARLRGRTDPERSNDPGDLHAHIRRLTNELDRMKRHIIKLERALGRP